MPIDWKERLGFPEVKPLEEEPATVGVFPEGRPDAWCRERGIPYVVSEYTREGTSRIEDLNADQLECVSHADIAYIDGKIIKNIWEAVPEERFSVEIPPIIDPGIVKCVSCRRTEDDGDHPTSKHATATPRPATHDYVAQALLLITAPASLESHTLTWYDDDTGIKHSRTCRDGLQWAVDPTSAGQLLHIDHGSLRKSIVVGPVKIESDQVYEITISVREVRV